MVKLFKQIILLLTIALMVLAIQAEKKCPENQEFTNCGSACPPKCEDNSLVPKFCTKQCVIGCTCKPGYLLNKNNECVTPEEC